METQRAFNPLSDANKTGFGLLCLGSLFLAWASYVQAKFDQESTMKKGAWTVLISAICVLVAGMIVLFLYD